MRVVALCNVVSTSLLPLTQAVNGMSTAMWGTEQSGELVLDEDKLKDALKKRRAHDKALIEMDDRKRKFNSMVGNEEVTLEEMEAYRISRNRGVEDPMTKFLIEEDGGE